MTTADAHPARPGSRRVHRIEVHPSAIAGDPAAASLVRDAAAIGVPLASAQTAKVYLIETDAPAAALERARRGLLADPVTEEAFAGARPASPGTAFIEVHPLPGVMDPAAASVREALRDLFDVEADVTTARRYDLTGVTTEQATRLAQRLLANPVVSQVHTRPYHPAELPRGHRYTLSVTHVPLRDLSDAQLESLSRDAHLFLSLDEMRAIQAEYRRLGKEPTDIELETLAQTWSEHCVHKTLKSRIIYSEGKEASGHQAITWEGRPGHTVNADGSVTIDNLLKRTVAAATHELIAEGHADWCLSVFKDNAGVIAFDDHHAVCVKVETHNHPSALEPYGGAATGIGGCIRDIIGTGLAAKPIASTDVFCVATPDIAEVPPGCLHPRRVLTEVVAGVRDYGNRMGIPTVNGAVYFDDRYIGNPLVYCGCIGVMPRGENDTLIHGAARPGDRIIALGGRTGRDGIHGATFSSAELTDTHADEFAHAVQIGNAIEEKRVLDAILRARDARAPLPLYNAITDCGAGGFSSAVGEMGAALGAEVHLDRAPLKYDGLSYTEIWISEAQERMILAVPPENLEALRRICDEEHVELADLGHFGTPGADLILHYQGTEVGRLPMHFIHEGIPMPTREAGWKGTSDKAIQRESDDTAPSLSRSISSSLLALLSHPNIASKHFIIRQYDHEVQGNTVVKPLAGPLRRGPMDAAVIEPVPGTGRGLAIACGLATAVGDPARGGDPYAMALAAIDECVRNLVCIGADPARIAILDNFCWPSCKKPENLAALVRACEGCYDGAKAYKTPFVSGKDSLNNQFTIPGDANRPARTIEIPPTLLITGIAIVDDTRACITMDAKRPGSTLLWVTGAEATTVRNLAGSHYAAMVDITGERTDTGEPVTGFPRVDLRAGPAVARAVAELIRSGRVRAAHDISDGGLLVALAEMLIAGSTPQRPIGATIGFQGAGPDASELFSEAPSGYLLEIDPLRTDAEIEAIEERFRRAGGHAEAIGSTNDSGVLSVVTSSSGAFDIPVADLAAAWLGTLDW